MSQVLAVTVDAGTLLPVSVMHAEPVRVLTAFVAINTVMYCALAVAKIAPRVHPSTWFQNANRRAQERSIFPAGGPDAEPDDRHRDARTGPECGRTLDRLGP